MSIMPNTPPFPPLDLASLAVIALASMTFFLVLYAFWLREQGGQRAKKARKFLEQSPFFILLELWAIAMVVGGKIFYFLAVVLGFGIVAFAVWRLYKKK